jgi:hypothetical protein
MNISEKKEQQFVGEIPKTECHVTGEIAQPDK